MVSQWKAINENYKKLDGYKRVAWPPVSEERIVREFTPQPQSHPSQEAYYNQQQQQQQQPSAANQQYRASSYDHYQQPSQRPLTNQQPEQHYQQPSSGSWGHNQDSQQQTSSFNYQSQAQPQQQQQFKSPYNSYSQPQQNTVYSQDQPDKYLQQPYREQSLPNDYRGGSPGIITLRKEAPISQRPAPVFNSQPAALSYKGGCNMRGDLKWPPQEYKEAAAKENEERRKLALGPVCRPRKVNRDYSSFFAKNAINNYYPSYKVPPGTQHMY